MKVKPPLKKKFSAAVRIVLGSTPRTRNPCVEVPPAVVTSLKAESGKNQSLPVRATLQGKPFKANVVKYRGAWRLYLNGNIRKTAGVEVGQRVTVTLRHDPGPRITPMPPAFAAALSRDKRAKTAFAALAPSRRKELLRYLGNLKREESLKRNIAKMLKYLKGVEVEASPTGLYHREKLRSRRR
ncbi:MAG: YdeI/OmpD-associated family protein [Gammaproteobacteria bacterium]